MTAAKQRWQGISLEPNLRVTSLVDVVFNSVEGSYPDDVTEIYTYKDTDNQVLRIVTIIYTDNTKQYILSAVKS